MWRKIDKACELRSRRGRGGNSYHPFFSGEISFFSNSFPILCHLKRELGVLWGCRSPYSAINHKAQAVWAAKSSIWGLLQGIFVLTHQPLSEIYLQSCSPESLPLVIPGPTAHWTLWQKEMLWVWTVSQRRILAVKWLEEISEDSYSKPSIYTCEAKAQQDFPMENFLSAYGGSDLLKWKWLNCVWLFATPWTIQSRPEYWGR